MDIKLPADINNLGKFLAAFRDFARDCGFPRDKAQEVEIALEEILVNIINHAYPDGPGEIELNCEHGLVDNAIRVEINDAGIYFDVLGKADPDVHANAEDRPIGGLGIYLVKKMMDQVCHERRDGKNILRLVKHA